MWFMVSRMMRAQVDRPSTVGRSPTPLVKRARPRNCLSPGWGSLLPGEMGLGHSASANRWRIITTVPGTHWRPFGVVIPRWLRCAAPSFGDIPAISAKVVLSQTSSMRCFRSGPSSQWPLSSTCKMTMPSLSCICSQALRAVPTRFHIDPQNPVALDSDEVCRAVCADVAEHLVAFAEKVDARRKLGLRGAVFLGALPIASR